MIPTHAALCAFAKDVHALAVEKGWYDTPRRWSQLLMLIQGEFHEANEDLRRGCAPGAIFDSAGAELEVVDGVLFYAPRAGGCAVIPYDAQRHGKIAGYLVEIADVAIRCLDAITYADTAPLITQPPSALDLAALAKLQADEFVETALEITQDSDVRDLSDVVRSCLEWCDAHGLPLWAVMQAKHSYNRTRPRKHGKVY